MDNTVSLVARVTGHSERAGVCRSECKKEKDRDEGENEKGRECSIVGGAMWRG